MTMRRETRNQLVRLSTDETLSEAFREACRKELGDRVAASGFDREWLVNAFLARLAVYRKKADDHMLGPDIALSRGEIAQGRQEAIEWLAAEIGIFDDLKAAGYEEVS